MSAAGIIGMLTNIISVGLFCAIVGYLIDVINGSTIFYNIAYSTLNTMNYITLIFWSFAFLNLIMNVLNYLITSASESGGYA